MEVKINVQKLVRSPLSFLVKVRELNIIGKLDFPIITKADDDGE